MASKEALIHKPVLKTSAIVGAGLMGLDGEVAIAGFALTTTSMMGMYGFKKLFYVEKHPKPKR